MKQRGILACAGTGLALTAVGWLLSEAPLADLSTDLLSRSAGVALLGIVLVAAGLVFHAAMRAEQRPAPVTTRREAGEYRRGFGDRAGRARGQARDGSVAAGATLSSAEVEWHGDRAKRPSPRGMVDRHELAPR